tara:strand:+ start:44240 stop:45463 length:1224 start_codon:yes stop_codon:yes gene_type:complete
MQIIESITKKDEFISTNKSKLQKLSFAKLKSNPLPNNKSEIWRLTSKPKFSRFLNYEIDDKIANILIPELPEAKNVIRIIIGENKNIELKKNNWEIRQIKEKEIISLIKQEIVDCDTTENWSNLLNHFLTNKKNIIGLNISGKRIPDIEIICNSKENFLNSKTLILNIEEGTKVNISQINLGDANSALSISSYLNIGKDAVLNHGIISYGDNKSNIINSLNVIQQKNSEYNLGSIQFKFDFARLELSINQVEGHAKTNIKGMQITKGNEQISTYAKISFNGPNGFLNQLNKSLAKGRSHSVFEGLIIVPQIAQKTDASQLSRNLLLSNYAKIDTKPQLEIIADDVKCMHGATISQLNENELFYMRSRGLTLAEASKLQLRSYYQEIISFLPISKDRLDLLALLLKNQ